MKMDKDKMTIEKFENAADIVNKVTLNTSLV